MKAVLSFGLILSLGFIVLAQQTAGQGGTVSVSAPKRTEEVKRQQAADESFKKLENLQTDDSEDSAQFYLLPEPRLTKEQKKQTALTKENLSAHTDFLKLPKTGIFKLLPNLCGDSRVIDVRNEKCLAKDIPSISFYSFRRKLYDSQNWSDLSYQNKQLGVGFKSLTIGLIAEIEDAQIDLLNGESEQVKILLEIKMPKKFEEISLKKKEIERGIEIGKLKLSDKAKIALNQTYILRSYAYRTLEAAANDRRIDIIVAFKIIGIDENEGLTIIWKELYKGNSQMI